MPNFAYRVYFCLGVSGFHLLLGVASLEGQSYATELKTNHELYIQNINGVKMYLTFSLGCNLLFCIDIYLLSL